MLFGKYNVIVCGGRGAIAVAIIKVAIAAAADTIIGITYSPKLF